MEGIKGLYKKTWRVMIRSRRRCGSYGSGRTVQSHGTPPTKAWEQVGAGEVIVLEAGNSSAVNKLNAFGDLIKAAQLNLDLL